MKKFYPIDFVPDGTKLEFIKEIARDGNCKYALYKCKCGKEKAIRIAHVKLGVTRSCGCLYKEVVREYTKEQRSDRSLRMTTHGLSRHPLYKVYHGILKRCYNKNSVNYKTYGAVGVRMCDEWLNDFVVFYKWAISNGWEDGMVIDKDKIPISLGAPAILYGPETCSVLTDKENMNSTKSNRIIEYLGRKQTLSQWADEFGIRLGLLWMRLQRGWSFKNAISSKKTTTKETGVLRRKIILNTETGIYYYGVKEAAESIGQSRNTVEHKMCGSRVNNTPLKYV